MSLKNEMYKISNELDMFTLLDLSNEMKRRGFEVTHADVVKMWEENPALGDCDLNKTLVNIELEDGSAGSTYVYHYGTDEDAHDVYDGRMFRVLGVGEIEEELEEDASIEPDNENDFYYRSTSLDGRLEIPTELIKKIGLLPYDICVCKSALPIGGFILSSKNNIDSWAFEYQINDRGRLRIPKMTFVSLGLPNNCVEYKIYSSNNHIVVKAE